MMMTFLLLTSFLESSIFPEQGGTHTTNSFRSTGAGADQGSLRRREAGAEPIGCQCAEAILTIYENKTKIIRFFI